MIKRRIHPILRGIIGYDADGNPDFTDRVENLLIDVRSGLPEAVFLTNGEVFDGIVYVDEVGCEVSRPVGGSKRILVDACMGIVFRKLLSNSILVTPPIR